MQEPCSFDCSLCFDGLATAENASRIVERTFLLVGVGGGKKV